MNGKLIFTVGLQCSGKSTWSKKICSQDKDHFRVCLDDLRLMRGKEDHRRDDIVKLELFLNHVAPRYNVQLVVDDRNQVVDMWRNMLNLRCLQVADGDF